MKILSFKKRLFLAFGTVFACIIFACSVFIIASKKDDTETVAVGNYTNQTQFINSLVDNTTYSSTYNMLERYPLAAENQTNSNFCWIYASLKALESSFMIQKNEYHNFSEMGSAYLYYTKITQNSEDGLQFIDVMGNFDSFKMLSSRYGLVYENSFSNDLYFDITESNFENYDYIYDYVDTTIMNDVVNIDFSDASNFVSFSTDTKIQVMKKYIIYYGGIFAGIEEGTIINKDAANDKLTYKPTTQHNNDLDGQIYSSHAVCLVGWKKDAFLALNSWGASYDLFWIPFTYSNLYSDLHGFIFNDSVTKKLTTMSSTAGGTDGFANKFNPSFYEQNNLFVYNEPITFEFKIDSESSISNFDNIFVYIYKGMEDVTDKFSIDFFDENLVIKISANLTSANASQFFDGYVIKFVDYETLISFKDFYIFSGNEVSYVQLIQRDRERSKDSTLFNNNLASGTYSQTYYIFNEENNDYNIELYLSRFNSYSKSNNIILYTYIYQIVNGQTTSISGINANVDNNVDVNSNFFRIKLSNLVDGKQGKTILIKVGIGSYVTHAQTEYYFIFHIGSVDGTITNNSNRIVYELEGGKNNPLNVNRYPNYSMEDESTIQNYKLLNPTRSNSVFIGWYLDPEYTVGISELSPNISSSTMLDKYEKFDINMNSLGYYSRLLDKKYSDDIVIYARWEDVEVQYFNIEFDVEKIKSHDGTIKDYTGQTIIYGDSVILKLTFTPYLENLTTYKYLSKYEYTFKNKLVETEYMADEGETVEFENSYFTDHLICGNYTASVKVIMVISHQFSVEKEVELTYSIDKKKDVTVSYDSNSLSYIYDKQAHLPSVSFGGVYTEDLENLTFTFDRSAAIEAGEYNFTITSINNANYELSGNLSSVLKIDTRAIRIEYFNTEKVYNGSYQFPEYNIFDSVDDEFVSVSFTEKNMKNVGEYRIGVAVINDINYHLEGVTNCIFKITKAQITVDFENISERFTVAPNNRKEVKWSVSGDIHDPVDSLGIAYMSSGESATSSGTYPIIGYLSETNITNSNYDITFNNGTYTILGYYYVYYTLPNGEIYVETVDEGENPAGITDEIYKLSLFSKFEYDKELVGNGLTDLHIKVSITSYAWAVWIGVGVLIIVVLYLTLTRKERKNKTR